MIYTGEDQILSGGRDGLIKSWCKKVSIPVTLQVYVCNRFPIRRLTNGSGLSPHTTHANWLVCFGIIGGMNCGLAAWTKACQCGGDYMKEFCNFKCT